MANSDIVLQANAKLDQEIKTGNRHANAICDPVRQTLKYFCQQNQEFARAVIDGGSFQDCLETVAIPLSSKQYASDLEIYQSAVRFYFPTAKIEFKMLIHLSEFEQESVEESVQESVQAVKTLDISLDDLL